LYVNVRGVRHLGRRQQAVPLGDNPGGKTAGLGGLGVKGRGRRIVRGVNAKPKVASVVALSPSMTPESIMTMWTICGACVCALSARRLRL